MMTALNIEEYTGEGLCGLRNLFRRNRIRVEHRYCDTAAVKCVCYEHYRGEISWASIDRFVKAQRNRLLCPPELSLPEGCGYRRFESYELSRRMCGNAALYLLRQLDRRDVKVALVDRSGESVGLCEALTDYADPVYAVTDDRELYAAQAEHLLSEKGAAIHVSCAADCLRGADLIIAPERIEHDMGCSPTAVILSGEQPAVAQNAPVIYDYFFDPAEKYCSVKPDFLEEMYFASALYAMAGAHELGRELFTRCGDGTTIHTRMSLLALLKKRVNS